MTSIRTAADYAAASARLASISAAPDLREGWERVVEANGDLNDEFLAAVHETGLSLDWLLTGEGQPYREPEGDAITAEFIACYRHLEPRQRKLLRDLVWELSGKAAD